MPNEKRPAHFWEKKTVAPKPSVTKPAPRPSITKPGPKAGIEKPSALRHKFKVERVATGITGFDRLVEGGLKKNSITLVEGGAGAGKTIFCTQFLVDGILKYNEPSVCINFEEEKEEFYQNMLRFGWDLKKLESENKFAFVKYAPEQVEKLLSAGGGVIRDIIDRVGAKRIVVDSLTSYTLLHKSESDKRDSLLLLFKTLKKWGCTTLVTGEPYEDFDNHPFNVLDFEVDGVIRLYNVREHKVRNRTLEVFKMRGTKHSAKTFSFAITDNGIGVYSEG